MSEPRIVVGPQGQRGFQHCGRVSWNTHDVEQRYCVACHQFFATAREPASSPLRDPWFWVVALPLGAVTYMLADAGLHALARWAGR